MYMYIVHVDVHVQDVVVLGEALLSQNLVQDDVLHRVEHVVH